MLLLLRTMFAASALMLAACASFPEAPAATTSPRFEDGALISIDGARLGLTVWEAESPQAILIAVHGMNDYAGAFRIMGPWLAENAGISVYAYDQRGFGRSPDFGRWPGAETMTADLRAAIAAARAAHPGLPLYVTGHSMGAAVVLDAMEEEALGVDGVILAAPGVWGGAEMPIPYRLALNIAATIAPGKTLTGERAGRQATDNIDLLRAMIADPYVIKETRIDAVLGVARLMGAGYAASDAVGGRVLVLIGGKDEIIPIKTMRRAAGRLCGEVATRDYPEGWHMLYGDLQAETVFADVAAFIQAGIVAGPESGAGPATSSCAGADGGRSDALVVRDGRPGSGV